MSVRRTSSRQPEPIDSCDALLLEVASSLEKIRHSAVAVVEEVKQLRAENTSLTDASKAHHAHEQRLLKGK